MTESGNAVSASLTKEEINSMNSAQISSVVTALQQENDTLKKFIAAEDAAAVVKATAGIGTDESRLV